MMGSGVPRGIVAPSVATGGLRDRQQAALRVQRALRHDLPGKGLSGEGWQLLDLAMLAAGLAGRPRPGVTFAAKRVTPVGDGARDSLNAHIIFPGDGSPPRLTIYLPIAGDTDEARERQFRQTLRHEVWHYRQWVDGRPHTGRDAEAECDRFAGSLEVC